MYKIGELVIYSEHGVCKIDDICDKTYGGKTRTYYVLHPIENKQLSINIPVQNNKVIMMKVMDVKEAKKILHSFTDPGIEWIFDVRQRNKEYTNIIQTGNRIDISKIVNTLMRKMNEQKQDKKNLTEQDKKLLVKTQHILFEELAIALNTTYQEIDTKVHELLKEAS